MKSYALLPFILQTLAWIPTRLYLKVFYKLEITGVENIKNLNSKFIFAANHISELDPIVIPISLPFMSSLMPLFYTCREKDFYKNDRFGWKKYIYGGLFFNMWGAYEVIVGKNNYQLALKNHIQIIKDGYRVCIFPDGKRNIKAENLEPKGGVAYLSHITNTPVIPLKISVEIERKKIIVRFGAPLYPKDIFPDLNNIILYKDHDDYKIAAKLIMKKVLEI